jgi:hypothetical protein
MLGRVFIKLILFSLLSVIQLSFISFLPSFFGQINLLLIFLVFYLETNDSIDTVWWFFLVGLIFDLYNSPFFGFWLLFWPLVFLFCRFFYVNVLTNRSLYSFLGLSAMTSAFYFLLSGVIFYIAGIFDSSTDKTVFYLSNFWLDLLFGVIINLAVVFIMFHLTNQVSNRLRPVFIFRKK